MFKYKLRAQSPNVHNHGPLEHRNTLFKIRVHVTHAETTLLKLLVEIREWPPMRKTRAFVNFRVGLVNLTYSWANINCGFPGQSALSTCDCGCGPQSENLANKTCTAISQHLEDMQNSSCGHQKES